MNVKTNKNDMPKEAEHLREWIKQQPFSAYILNEKNGESTLTEFKPINKNQVRISNTEFTFIFEAGDLVKALRKMRFIVYDQSEPLF